MGPYLRRGDGVGGLARGAGAVVLSPLKGERICRLASLLACRSCRGVVAVARDASTPLQASLVPCGTSFAIISLLGVRAGDQHKPGLQCRIRSAASLACAPPGPMIASSSAWHKPQRPPPSPKAPPQKSHPGRNEFLRACCGSLASVRFSAAYSVGEAPKVTEFR